MIALPLAFERWLALFLTVNFLVTPLYPSIVGLTPISPPGVSLIAPIGAFALMLFALGAGIVAALAVLRVPGKTPPTARPLFIYVAAVALAAVLGFEPRTGLLFAVILLIATAAHIAIVRFSGSALVTGGVFGAFLVGGIAASVVALVMVVTRSPAALYTVGHGRAIGTFVVPGELAGYLLLLIPTAGGVALVTRRPLLRGIAIAAMLSGALALAATFSRAGWLGALAGAIFLAYTLRRRALAGAIGTAALVMLALSFIVHAHHNPSEDFTRLAIWRTGLRTAQLFPLTGVGPGGFRLIYPALRPPDGELTAFHAHNLLLTSFAEMGIVGLLATLGMWYVFARELRSALRGAGPQARTLALSLAAGCVATAVQSLFDVIQMLILGLWIPFMALTLGAARNGLCERAPE